MLFLCYRRDDSSESTDRIREWLEDRLAPGQVFMDVFSIEGGEDWRHIIKKILPKSQAVLVIIGPRWKEADLNDPTNPSRFENRVWPLHTIIIIPIIPVLVQFAQMPSRNDVPPSLAEFIGITAVSVRPGPERQGDLERLRRVLEKLKVSFHRLRNLPNRSNCV